MCSMLQGGSYDKLSSEDPQGDVALFQQMDERDNKSCDVLELRQKYLDAIEKRSVLEKANLSLMLQNRQLSYCDYV